LQQTGDQIDSPLKLISLTTPINDPIATEQIKKLIEIGNTAEILSEKVATKPSNNYVNEPKSITPDQSKEKKKDDKLFEQIKVEEEARPRESCAFLKECNVF